MNEARARRTFEDIQKKILENERRQQRRSSRGAVYSEAQQLLLPATADQPITMVSHLGCT